MILIVHMLLLMLYPTEVQERGGDSSAPAGPDGNAADKDQSLAHQVSQQISRKRLRHDFPWSQTRDWQDSDPQRVRGRRHCNLCKKRFSLSTNAEGWKVHLINQHDVKATPSMVLHGDTEEAVLLSRQSLQVQQSMKMYWSVLLRMQLLIL